MLRIYSLEIKSQLQWKDLDSYYTLKCKRPSEQLSTVAAVIYKPQNYRFQGVSWSLLTSEETRGGQLDPQEAPLQDAIHAGLCERTGRLQCRENSVINFIEQQLQAWEIEVSF